MNWRLKLACVVAAVLVAGIALTCRSMLAKHRLATLTPAELQIHGSNGVGLPVPPPDPSEAGRWASANEPIDIEYLTSEACRLKPVRSPEVASEFKLLQGESYRNWPVVAFNVGEDGKVSDIRLVRSCGIDRIDKQVLTAVSRSKYRPRPRCGVSETTLAVHIHW